MVDQESCHSSLTSTSHLLQPDHKSMPLERFVSLWLYRTDVEGGLPAPRPFSPFSNSSSSLKFRGTLALMVRTTSCCKTSEVLRRERDLIVVVIALPLPLMVGFIYDAGIVGRMGTSVLRVSIRIEFG